MFTSYLTHQSSASRYTVIEPLVYDVKYVSNVTWFLPFSLNVLYVCLHIWKNVNMKKRIKIAHPF